MVWSRCRSKSSPVLWLVRLRKRLPGLNHCNAETNSRVLGQSCVYISARGALTCNRVHHDLQRRCSGRHGVSKFRCRPVFLPVSGAGNACAAPADLILFSPLLAGCRPPAKASNCSTSDRGRAWYAALKLPLGGVTEPVPLPVPAGPAPGRSSRQQETISSSVPSSQPRQP